MILDVPTNWRKWSSWMSGHKPDEHEGHPVVAVDPNIVVVVTDPFEIVELRGWLAEQTRSSIQMWGRWDFIRHAYRIDRDLEGLVVQFGDPDEAFHFKMRWG